MLTHDCVTWRVVNLFELHASLLSKVTMSFEEYLLVEISLPTVNGKAEARQNCSAEYAQPLTLIRLAVLLDECTMIHFNTI